MEEIKKEEQKNNKEKNTGMAALCYFGFLVFIPLLTEAKKDPYVKFHIKQGLVLFIVEVIVSFLSTMFFFMLWYISYVFGIIIFILFIIGLMNALNGKEEKLPIIGKYAESIKI